MLGRRSGQKPKLLERCPIGGNRSDDAGIDQLAAAIALGIPEQIVFVPSALLLIILGANEFEQWISGRHHRVGDARPDRSEEHTSELQSLMRISYAVLCLKKKKTNNDLCD